MMAAATGLLPERCSDGGLSRHGTSRSRRAASPATELTLKRQEIALTGNLVEAVTEAWGAIKQRHPDVPTVVLAMASGKDGRSENLGHFAPGAWTADGATVGELFVSGESLKHGAEELLNTLIHEAAHAAAHARGVKDTSRGGRYHNRRYKEIAESMGLAVDHDPSIGFSLTKLPSETAREYGSVLARLSAAIIGYRRGGAELLEPEASTPPPVPSRNNVKATCGCGTVIRASRKVIAAGTVVCAVCAQPFAAAVEKQRAVAA